MGGLQGFWAKATGMLNTMKKAVLHPLIGVFLFALVSVVPPSSAQVLMSAGSPYTQSFDTLASSGTANTWTDNSTLRGWYASKTSGGTSVSSYQASTGTGITGAIYSFGASGSSERALGSLASGTTGNLAYGVRLLNDTGASVSNLIVSYTGEQWRNGGTTIVEVLSFSYTVSSSPITTSDAGSNSFAWTPVTALDFSTPTVGVTAAALDGNAAANRRVIGAVTLPGVVLAPAQEIFLRWFDPNDPVNDHGVAIDDLTITFSGAATATNAPTYAQVTPSAQTNKAGTTAVFNVANDGSPGASISYQWRKGGAPLSDLNNVSGAATPALTITNVLAADAGSYDVIVANPAGSVTSAVAVLTVTDPVILAQSGSQTRLAGEALTFTVSAKGTPTLAYQWSLGGLPIAAATTSALNFANIQATNQGTYVCCISNGLGASLTSAPITLTVVVLPAVRIALWDFNNTNASVSSPPPIVGSGTAALLNGVGASYATGCSTDLAGTNRAWNTAGYPSQGASNQTAGVQFNVSTLGYQNILLMWNERHSSGASKYTRLQSTADGGTFNDLDLNAAEAADNFALQACDLTGAPAANNNPNFAFRIVSAFASTADTNYVGTSGSYGTSGTIRFDLVSVYGDPFSAPTVAPTTISNLLGAALTYGGGAGSRFVLLKSASPAAALSGWSRVQTNFGTPGAFTVPAGAERAACYRIKSE
jgi:hypothetical protein